MPKALILLIGDQPMPNLLPTRHLQPDTVVLVYTGRTRDVAQRLHSMLDGFLCEVHPYDLPAIQDSLQQFVTEQLQGYEIVFNLTGGTKTMSLVAFLVASQLNAPFVYFRTESGHLLYHYQFTGQKDVRVEKQEETADSITLDDYLRAQVGEYTTEPPRDAFEQQVYEALRLIPGLEILTSVRPQGLEALEVDFMIRLGNQVGVIEAKTKGAKSGIDQIQAVAAPLPPVYGGLGGRYLGTYVAKFLVSGRPVDRNNKNLAKAYKIEAIEVLSYGSTGTLSKEDQEKLRQRILKRLRGE